MCKISNNARQDGIGDFESSDRDSSEDSGWKDKSLLEPRISDNVYNYINHNILLKDIFQRYNLEFEEKYSIKGWTYSRECPFPDHFDKTPSFNYNPKENRFYCFGCKRGGQAIQFVANMNKITRESAAELLLKNLGDVNSLLSNIKEEKKNNVSKILLEFSNFIREFLQRHKNYNSIVMVEKLTWGLDLYLLKYMPSGTINEDNLIARIKLIKEKLNE